VFPSGIKNLLFVAAHSDLHAAELALATRKGYSCELLQKKLSPLQSEYDYIFFDTHPCLGPLTTNAIRASNFLLVPLQCAYLAYDALPHMMKMLTDIKLRLHPPLLLLGLLMTMMDKGETFPLVMQEKVTQHFGRLAFKNVVPRDPQMQGASGKELLPVLQRPRSPVAAAYRRLAQEIEERIVYINQMETAKGAP
jgi:chromosome partitioning protein